VRFRKPKLSDILGGKDIKSKKVLKQRTQHLFDDGSHQSVQQQARDERNNVPNPLPCHRFRHLPTPNYSAGTLFRRRQPPKRSTTSPQRAQQCAESASLPSVSTTSNIIRRLQHPIIRRGRCRTRGFIVRQSAKGALLFGKKVVLRGG